MPGSAHYSGERVQDPRSSLVAHKREGPTTCITFLGILIDMVAGQLRLPPEKLSRLCGLLQEWGDRKSSTRKELESLVGHLNHACKVVRSGRSFLRCMFDLLHAVKLPSHSSARMRLSRGFCSDLAWWQEFVLQWNGVSFLLPPSHLPQLDMSSDASGSWGCGAWHQSRWLQVQWGPQSQSLSITEKELVPIILACDLWGRAWQGRRVRCHCDNQVVVACLRSRTSKNEGLMHLLHCLVFVEAQHQCHLVAEYIDTKSNHLADDLSHNRASSFLFKVPEADHHPSPVSLPLLSLLLDHQANWTSPTWRHQLIDISRRVYPPPHRRPTSQPCTAFTTFAPPTMSPLHSPSLSNFSARMHLTSLTSSSCYRRSSRICQHSGVGKYL